VSAQAILVMRTTPPQRLLRQIQRFAIDNGYIDSVRRDQARALSAEWDDFYRQERVTPGSYGTEVFDLVVADREVGPP
jgi:uncharacterized lipoprotein